MKFLAPALLALGSPLTRNGYALVMSAGITSVLGLIFWILAAHYYPPEQVGLAAALLSMLLTLGNIAQLNLGNVLNRFLPVANDRSAKLIARSYGAAVAAAAVFSSVFVLGVTSIAPKLSFLGNDWQTASLFIASVTVWTLFVLQDGVLAGLRQSSWIPLENAVYALMKIALLVALAGVPFRQSSIFLAWVLPLPLLVVVVNAAIFVHLGRHSKTVGAPNSDIGARTLARFVGWDFAGTVAMMLALGAAPLLVLNLSGTEATANYHLAWTISYSLYLIGRSMGISLLAEGVVEKERLVLLASDALVHTLFLLAAALAIILVGAPLIMGLFGPVYAREGTGLLRVLCLACVPWSLVTLHLAVARANGHLVKVAVVQIATLILAIGLGAPLVHLWGAFGMGVAWLIAHSAVAIGLAVHVFITRGADHLVVWMLATASAVSRLLASFRRFRGSFRPLPTDMHKAQSLLVSSAIPGASDWQTLQVISSQSDVQTAIIGELPDRAHAVLKTTLTSSGMISLISHCEQVRRISADSRLAGCGIAFPEILGIDQSTDEMLLLERVLPGEDGRAVLRRARMEPAALKAAARAMTGLHARTSAACEIGEAWLTKWIDQPAALLTKAHAMLMSAAARQAAITAFRHEQRLYWSGRQTRLGLGHGDYSPGNILFETGSRDVQNPQGADTSTSAKVSAIIDWDKASQDAPFGIDICNLALTCRTLSSGDDLGRAVCTLLLDPSWTQEEIDWISVTDDENPVEPAWYRDDRAIRALIGLAWLHHVAGNLEKSDSYATNWLWMASNVERVLKVYTVDARRGAD
ncbi:MAG: phosphotransferase [Rhizobiaceae bacterium]